MWRSGSSSARPSAMVFTVPAASPCSRSAPTTELQYGTAVTSPRAPAGGRLSLSVVGLGASASRSPRTLKIFRRAQRQSESGGIRTVEANKTLARLAVDHRDGGLLAAESLDL